MKILMVLSSHDRLGNTGRKITINGWNRFAIGFRKLAGEYQPHKIG